MIVPSVWSTVRSAPTGVRLSSVRPRASAGWNTNAGDWAGLSTNATCHCPSILVSAGSHELTVVGSGIGFGRQHVHAGQDVGPGPQYRTCTPAKSKSPHDDIARTNSSPSTTI